MSNLPEKFTIPKDRIPKPWSQGVYGCCVAASITKVLEVINYVKTGTYTMLSKGYVYGKHNHPNKKQGGMDYAYAMESLLKHGTVPEEMFPKMNEMPGIRDDVANHPDIKELDKEAEKTRIKSYTKIRGDIHFYDNVKKFLYEHQMPLVGNMVGKRHCTVIVGWDGDKLLYHDHDGRDTLTRGKFNEAYYLDGGIENNELSSTGNKESNEEENDMGYKLMNVSEFKNYLDSLNITRRITLVQLHHTYSPSYSQFTGNNHMALQKSMRDYHVKERGFADIAQTFTIFPDGKICTGRDINKAPAGIYGANSTGVCIECVGNFDKGGDTMTEAQKNAIVSVTRMLLDRLKLNARTGVTYHAWWSEGGTNLGTYNKARSAKTCPGTGFFGGNTRDAYEKNLMPLIESYGKEEKKILETPNDITWELNHTYFPIDDVEGFKKVLSEAQKNNSPLYWGYYKLVNRIK